MSSPSILKALHEIVILAAGRAATQEEIELMLSLEGNGNWAPLINVINSFMSNLAESSGSTALVKAMALNGTAVTLSDTAAAAKATSIDSGETTWADYFIENIFDVDDAGKVLDNRADAAFEFVTDLAAADKSSFYAGSSVVSAVTGMIQGVTGTAASVTKAKAGLDTLVTALSAEGISSKLVDGYISGGSVGVDTDGDGLLSADEILATTDAQGSFTLPADSGTGKLLAFGGTDIMTGKAFQGLLSAPAGSTVVNPITTVLQAVVDSGKSISEANTIVQKAFGLPEDSNPKSYDPLAVLADENATTEQKTAALGAQSKALQVSNVIVQSSAAINSGSGDATRDSAANAVTKAIAAKVTESADAEQEIDLTDTTTLVSIIETAATEAGETEVAAQSSQLAAIASTSNNSAKNATTVEALAKVAVVSQGDAVTDIETAVSAGEDLDTVVESYSEENLAAAVETAEVGTIFQAEETDASDGTNSDGGSNTGGGNDTGQGGGLGGAVVDTIPPIFISFSVSAGSKSVILTTDETVAGTPANSDFSVTSNSVNNPVTEVAVSGTTVTLTLTNYIENSATVTLGYTQSSSFVSQIRDATGNPLATLSSAATVTVTPDGAEPTVTGVSSTSENDSYSIGDLIPVTVTFSEPVIVNTSSGTPTLTLETGTTDRAATYASGSDSAVLVFNYTVQSGDTSDLLSYTGTNALTLNSGTIEDRAGNTAELTLATAGQANSLSANKAIAIDGALPTLSASAATEGTKTVTLTLSEAVTGSPATGDFSVTSNAVANPVTLVAVSGTTVTLTLTNYIEDSATVAYTKNSTAENQLRDAGGNALATLGSAATVTVTPDGAVPTVTGVSAPDDFLDGSYSIGDLIPVTVTFSEPVIVDTSGGTPSLTLETGTTDRTATYASGSDSAVLVFNYTVQSGDTSDLLSYTGTNALTLNSGTIEDRAGNTAALTLATAGQANSLSANRAIAIDGALPTLSASAATEGTKTVTLTLSEAVTGSPATGDFTVTSNAVANPVTLVAVSGTTVTLTLTNYIEDSATVAYTKNSTAENQLRDAGGNALATLGSAATVTVTPDGAEPTVTGVSSTSENDSYSIGDLIPVTVTFSEPVIVNTSSGTPTLTLETGTTDRAATYASGSDSAVLVFNYTVQSGDTSDLLSYTGTNALTLNSGTIEDRAGNTAELTLATAGQANSLSANKAIAIDGALPTLSASAATEGTKTVTLTLSEAVTGSPATGDFSVTSNAVANPVTLVAVSGTTVTLTLTNYIEDSATVAYTKNSTAENQLRDAGGNALATLGSAATVTVTPDGAVPTVTGVSAPDDFLDGSYSIGDLIPVTVTFSEPVIVDTSGGTPSLTLETGTTDRTATYASGSDSAVLVFNYTVQSGDTSDLLSYTGTNALTLNSGTIEDRAGNTAALTLATAGQANSLSANRAIAIDGALPTLSASAATEGTKTVTLTLSEAVTGSPATGDFTVTSNAVANPVTLVAVSGTTVTLTLTNYIEDSATVAYTKNSTAENQLRDAGGNALATLGSAATVTVTPDGAVPTVTGVSAPDDFLDGSYSIGDLIPVTVTFSEPVIVDTSGGTPSLTLETGTTDRTATYASGSDSAVLVFNYTVQSGDTSDLLSYTGTNALTLNSGTIEDRAGNTAALTLATAGQANSLSANRAIAIDGALPTLSASAATEGTKTVTLTLSEAVTGSPATGDFTVTSNAVANPVTLVAVSGTTVTLTLTNYIEDSATVAYTKNSTAENQLRDAGGNALATLGSAATVTVTPDGAVPTVTGVSSTSENDSYSIGDLIPVTVTFSEPVIVNTSSGTPTLTLETGTTDRAATYASGSDSAVLVFNYTVQSGDTSDLLSYTGTNALTLNSGTIEDRAGNTATLTLATAGQANSLSANKAIAIDGVAPTFRTGSGDTSPVNGGTLTGAGGVFPDIVLDFSEAIQSIAGVTLIDNISITAPQGAGDKSVNFTASIVSGNLIIDIDETDADIAGAVNQTLIIDVAANTLSDIAGNNAVEIVGINSYSLLATL